MMAHYFTKDCEVRPLLQYIETTKNQLWSVNGYATVRIDSDIPEAFQDCLLKLDGDEFTINPPTGVSMKQNVDAVMARTFESDEYQSTTFDLRRLILDEKQEVDHYGKAWIPVGTGLLVNLEYLMPLIALTDKCQVYYAGEVSPVGFDFGKVKIVVCTLRQSDVGEKPIEIMKLRESCA